MLPIKSYYRKYYNIIFIWQSIYKKRRHTHIPSFRFTFTLQFFLADKQSGYSHQSVLAQRLHVSSFSTISHEFFYRSGLSDKSKPEEFLSTSSFHHCHFKVGSGEKILRFFTIFLPSPLSSPLFYFNNADFSEQTLCCLKCQ